MQPGLIGDAVAERKLHCPETDSDCTSQECSIRICLLRQGSILFEQRIAEWEADFRTDSANREAGAWRAVRELEAEHNSLIGANKTGILTDRTGELVKTRVKFRERGQRGSKKFIADVLQSKKPYTVTRLRNAMDAILAETKAQLLRRR